MLTINELIQQLQAATRDDHGPCGVDFVNVCSPKTKELNPIESVEWDFNGVKLNIEPPPTIRRKSVGTLLLGIAMPGDRKSVV